MVREPIASLDGVGAIREVRSKHGGAQNAVADLVEPAGAEELGQGRRVPFDLVPVGQLLGIAEENWGGVSDSSIASFFFFFRLF